MFIESILLVRHGQVVSAVHALGFSSLAVVSAWIVALGEYGQLKFSGMLHGDVYTTDSAAIALNLIVISSTVFITVLTSLSAGLSFRWSAPSLAEVARSRLFAPILLAIAVPLVYATTGGSSIFQETYTGTADSRVIESGGIDYAALLLFGTAIGVSFRAYPSGAAGSAFRVAAIALFLFIKTIRGDRGGTLLVIICVAVSWFLSNTRRNSLRVGLVPLSVGFVVMFVAQLMGDFRALAADNSLDAALRQSLENTFATNGDGSLDPLRIQLVPAGLWHILNTIEMRSDGTGPGFAGFTNLLWQIPPESVLNSVGFERPMAGAGLFQYYRVSNGGNMFIAETYWYGGVLGLLVSSAVLALILFSIEVRICRSEPIVALPLLCLAGGSLVTLYYGLQTLMKGFLISLLLSYCMSLLVASGRSFIKPRISK
jgi:hypothetical protein